LTAKHTNETDYVTSSTSLVQVKKYSSLTELAFFVLGDLEVVHDAVSSRGHVVGSRDIKEFVHVTVV